MSVQISIEWQFEVCLLKILTYILEKFLWYLMEVLFYCLRACSSNGPEKKKKCGWGETLRKREAADIWGGWGEGPGGQPKGSEKSWELSFLPFAPLFLTKSTTYNFPSFLKTKTFDTSTTMRFWPSQNENLLLTKNSLQPRRNEIKISLLAPNLNRLSADIPL